MQNTKAVRLGEKTPAFAKIFCKMRTYFRGGTVLYRVGALEVTIFFVSRKSFEHKIMLTPKFFIAKYIVARKFLCAKCGLNTNQIRSIWLVSFCLNFTFVYEKRHNPLHTSNNFCTFAQNLKHTCFGTTENMNKVRITAIRQTVYPDLIAQYENPASSHE